MYAVLARGDFAQRGNLDNAGEPNSMLAVVVQHFDELLKRLVPRN